MEEGYKLFELNFRPIIVFRRIKRQIKVRKGNEPREVKYHRFWRTKMSFCVIFFSEVNKIYSSHLISLLTAIQEHTI